MFMALINKNYAFILWRGVPSNKRKELGSRVVQRTVNNFFTMYCIKYLSLGIVAVVSQTSPLFVTLLGYFMLKERITKEEFLYLMLAFFGILIFLWSGSDFYLKENEGQQWWEIVLAFIFVMLIPVLLAFGNIQLRQLKSVHEYTTTIYAIFASFVFFGMVLLLWPEQMTFTQTFDFVDYTYIALNAFFNGLSIVTRTLSLRYGPASKVSIYSYNAIIFSIIMDLIAF